MHTTETNFLHDRVPLPIDRGYCRWAATPGLPRPWSESSGSSLRGDHDAADEQPVGDVTGT